MSIVETPTITKTLRRTKEELGASTGAGRMSDLRLEWHFVNWRAWMRSGCDIVRGLPRASVGLYSGGGRADFDDMADASERRVAVACDAIIEGLCPSQRAAIYHKYLYAVYPFPRGNQAECLERGREGVRTGLERRGIW